MLHCRAVIIIILFYFAKGSTVPLETDFVIPLQIGFSYGPAAVRTNGSERDFSRVHAE